MLRTALIALLGTLSFAQTAAPPPASPQPPAEVDRALRARIKEFYDLLVDHKFRKAEELVAPDYRDTYYERDKPRYLSHELTSIAYSADFTRADVVVTVKMPPIHPIIPATATFPMPSIWRLLDGEWYWSLRKFDTVEAVRNIMGGDLMAAGASPPPALPPMPGGMGLPLAMPGSASLPAVVGHPEAMTMAAGVAGVPNLSMDREEVALKPSTTQTVTISNTGSAPMTLFLLGKPTGIEASFDHPRVEPGKKAVLSVHAAAEAASGMLIVGVTETRAMTSLPITVK